MGNFKTKREKARGGGISPLSVLGETNTKSSKEETEDIKKSAKTIEQTKNKITTVVLPQDLHTKLRMHCLSKGLTTTKLIRELVEKEVSN